LCPFDENRGAFLFLVSACICVRYAGGVYQALRKSIKTRLPSDPNSAYAEEWEGWKVILKK
jgi:hypothetical protein